MYGTFGRHTQQAQWGLRRPRSSHPCESCGPGISGGVRGPRTRSRPCGPGCHGGSRCRRSCSAGLVQVGAGVAADAGVDADGRSAGETDVVEAVAVTVAVAQGPAVEVHPVAALVRDLDPFPVQRPVGAVVAAGAVGLDVADDHAGLVAVAVVVLGGGRQGDSREECTGREDGRGDAAGSRRSRQGDVPSEQSADQLIRAGRRDGSRPVMGREPERCGHWAGQRRAFAPGYTSGTFP